MCMEIATCKPAKCVFSPIIVPKDETIYSLFIYVNRCTCFGWYLHPSSGAHVTVSTAYGSSKTVTATCRPSSHVHNDYYYDYYYCLFLYFWRQEFCYLYLVIYGICVKFIGHTNFTYSPCRNIL